MSKLLVSFSVHVRISFVFHTEKIKIFRKTSKATCQDLDSLRRFVPIPTFYAVFHERYGLLEHPKLLGAFLDVQS